MESQEQAVVRNLKMLLMHLAAKVEHPEQVLQELLHEVIGELRDELQSRIQEVEPQGSKFCLRLVRSGTGSDMS